MGGGGKAAGQRGSEALDKFVSEFAEVSKPARETFFGQLQEALTTGGIGARIPIIQKSVEASKSATSAALRGTEESLAKAGIAGDPFGQRVLAQTRLAGETQTSQIPTNIIREMLAGAQSAVLGSAQTITGGFGQLAAVGAQREATAKQAFQQMFSSGIRAAAAVQTGGASELAAGVEFPS